ncbi:MAG TPA: S41 family peptidase [Drouetiella sp.]
MRRKLLLTIPLAIAFSLFNSSVIASDKKFMVAASDTELPKLLQTIRGGKVVDPERLYDRVFNLIKDDFYDSEVLGKQNWERWQHHYDGKLKTLEDAHKAIETMLASLGDRYTRFLDSDAFADEKSQIDAKLFGIGIQIGIDKDHRVIVITPIDDTPASRAGLQPGDEIAEIDGKATKGFSVEDAAKSIRGKIDTPVNLVLMRKKERVKVTVVRAEIPIKAVQTAKMLDSQVGYIRLSSFISQQANREMSEALGKMSSAKGIILDLRDNPGGLLTNAIDISNMFLESGNIVSTVDRDGYKNASPSDGRPISRQPLVVLVNKNSASASEITSGALKDNGRATLVGQTTFGKGLVQGINKLEDGSGVNVTIARYLTPNDTDINKKGIGPDVKVDITDKDMKDGKGPWWADPEGPAIKRSPEDMKDVQLKSAFEVCHRKIDDINPVAINAKK